jgi:hypothetical protein
MYLDSFWRVFEYSMDMYLRLETYNHLDEYLVSSCPAPVLKYSLFALHSAFPPPRPQRTRLTTRKKVQLPFPSTREGQKETRPTRDSNPEP